MAATQAEKQQNELNEADDHHSVRNSLLQNGTGSEKGVRGSVSANSVVVKGKNTGPKNLSLEMSQYRQDGGEQGLNDAEMGPGAAGSDAATGLYPPASEGQQAGPGEGAHGHGPAPGSGPAPGPGAGPPGYGGYPFPGTGPGQPRDMHNSGGEPGMHAFGARQVFGGPKQPPGGPGAPFSQPRFVSGQTISQPTGPTPTLNQLLQSSNTMHRYQNNYGHPEQPYNQGWPAQKPMPSYGPGPGPGPGPAAPPGQPPGPTYRNQASVCPPFALALVLAFSVRFPLQLHSLLCFIPGYNAHKT